jgi:uncharacterized membrane protein
MIAMEPLKTIALAIHIIGGSVALFTGLFNMIARKGGARHRKAGMLYAWSMYAVSFSALLLSGFINSIFFFSLGVFSFYMTWNGQQSAALRKVVFDVKDRLVLVAGILNTVLMLVNGNAILFGLGLLSATLVVREIVLFIKVRKGIVVPANTWLVRHIGMMVGSYISTLTAFLVVNWHDIGPYWIPWALPPAVLVPYIIWWSRKVSGVRRKAIAAVLLLPLLSSAQPYVEGGNTRHRFAQLNLGAGVLHTPAGGAIGEEPIDANTSTRLIIGGTHFWGHADFVLSIPMIRSRSKDFQEGVETKFKFYPWRVENKKVRPYAGVSWAMFSSQFGDGVSMERMSIPLLAGVSFNHGRYLFELGSRYNNDRSEKYWSTKDELVQFRSSPWSVSVGVKVMLETTLSAEEGQLNGRTKQLTDTLAARGKLNGFTIGGGAGTAFFTHRSSWMQNNVPWLDDHRISRPYFHVNGGFYVHRPDLQVMISYRNIRDRIEAFDTEQEITRRSVSLEAYHFFADFHGFVPFIGGCLSAEELQMVHRSETLSFTQDQRSFRPGIVAGWDIRPDRLQSFLLRTQVRYIPIEKFKMEDGGTISADQVEVDFIQLIVFPGRFF